MVQLKKKCNNIIKSKKSHFENSMPDHNKYLIFILSAWLLIYTSTLKVQDSREWECGPGAINFCQHGQKSANKRDKTFLWLTLTNVQEQTEWKVIFPKIYAQTSGCIDPYAHVSLLHNKQLATVSLFYNITSSLLSNIYIDKKNNCNKDIYFGN